MMGFEYEEAVRIMCHVKGAPTSKERKEASAQAMARCVREIGEAREGAIIEAANYFAANADQYPTPRDFAAKVFSVVTTGGILNPVWIVEEYQPCAATRNYAGQRNLETYEFWADADKAAQMAWERDFPEQARIVEEGIARHKARRRVA